MQNDIVNVGNMDWCDDLDDLRAVLSRISTRIEKRKKQENAHSYQAKSVAHLKDAINRRLERGVALETVRLASAQPSDILTEILKISGGVGISNIRYYRYTEDSGEGAYVLLDSAGYENAVEERLRVGELVRFRRSCPRVCTDTFWAHELSVPVVISVDRSASSILEPRFYIGCLPQIQIPTDTCEETLHGKKSTTWIDFPLVVGGAPVGKLTCDYYGPPEKLSEQSDGFVDLWANALHAAPYLELLARNRSKRPLNDIVGDIQACKDIASLFDYCVTKLPSYFEGRNASLFTLSVDSLGFSKLILRKTSFSGATHDENRSAYDLNDSALTAWVARNGKAIRVHNLRNEHDREHQLQQYRVFDDRLTWQNRITDSDSHTSFLAVPIMVDANRVGGVIRITEKVGTNKYFTELDEIHLGRIAAEAIGRRLASLQASESLRSLSYSDVQKTNALLVSEAIPTTTNVADSLKGILPSLFPEMNDNRKLFLLNVLETDCLHFQHFYVGGQLPNSLCHLDKYKLERSLTGYVVKAFLNGASANQDNLHSTLIVDFPNAMQQGAMLQICEDAEVALACPVAFRHKIYGVLILKSNRFDLTLEQCGHTLQLVAAQAGMMFAKRDHSCLTRLKARIDEVSSRFAGGWLVEAERCLNPQETLCNHDPLEPLNIEKLFAEAAAGVAADAGCTIALHGAYSAEPVIAHRQAMFSVVYSVLKEACTRESDEGLHIHSTVREKWLEVTIKEFFRTADPLLGEMWMTDTDSLLHSDKGDELTLARKFAYYNEVGNRRASIDRSDRDLVLRFPAG